MQDTENENKELDQYGVWVKASDSAPAEQDDSLPDFSFLDEEAPALDSTDDMFKTTETQQDSSTEEFVLDDFIAGTGESISDSAGEETGPSAEESIDLDSFTQGEETAPSPEESVPDIPDTSDTVDTSAFDIPDGEVDLDSFFDSPSSDTQGAPQEDGEISLDAFMGDSSSASSDSGEISLDSFLDPSEFGLSSEEKKDEEETTSYENPIDINLSFDDNLEQTYEEEEEPVQAAPTIEASQEDFEDVFNNIEDEGSSPSRAVPDTSAISTESEEVDLSAFGLGDEDTGFVEEPDETKPKATAAVDYDIAVDDDDEDSDEPPVSEQAQTQETDDRETETVSIQMEQAPKEVPQQSDTSDFGAPDDSFDVDSILNSVQDDNAPSEDTEESSSVPDTFDEETASLTLDDFNFDETESTETTQTFSESETFSGSETTESETFSESETSEDFAEPQIASDETFDDDEFNVASSALEDNFDTEGLKANDLIEDDDLFGSEEETKDSYEIPEFLPDENNPGAEASDEVESAMSSVEFDDTNEDAPSEEPLERSSPKANASEAVDNSEILKSIATELASLKSEIAGLKTEFEGLKQNGIQSQTVAEPVKTTSSGFFGDTDDTDDSITLSMEELNNVAKDASEAKGFFGDSEDEDDSITLSMEELNNVAKDAESSSRGFFGDSDDDDDSIALSGDELSNIINSADITEEENAVQAPQGEIAGQTDFSESDAGIEIPDDTETETDNKLSMDFANESLEEPVFEEDESESLELNEDEVSDLPDEISLPKDDGGTADDIFVESSSSDMLTDEGDEVAPGGTVEDIPTDDIEEEEAEVQYSRADGLGDPIDLYENDEVQPMTEENFQYIEQGTEDEADDIAGKVFVEAGEDGESAINEEPTEAVFTQWQGEENSPEEEIADDADDEAISADEEIADTESAEVYAAGTVSFDASEETVPTVETVSRTAPSAREAIPEDMKQEIKSVLSYMDQLLDSLPEDKITEFAKSDQFETYKKLFTELGLA